MGVAGNVGYWNRNRVVVEAGSIPRTQLKWNSGDEHQPHYIHHGEGGFHFGGEPFGGVCMQLQE